MPAFAGGILAIQSAGLSLRPWVPTATPKDVHFTGEELNLAPHPAALKGREKLKTILSRPQGSFPHTRGAPSHSLNWPDSDPHPHARLTILSSLAKQCHTLVHRPAGWAPKALCEAAL